MKPLAQCPDAERVIVDYLTEQLAARNNLTPVGVGVPPGWTLGSGDFVQVELDGTPVSEAPVAWRSTLRVTAWSASRSKAKDLAALCEALLMAHPGDRVTGCSGCLPGTGVLMAQDPDTKAQLASVTALVKLRGIPL